MARKARIDGWKNLLTALGTSGDKRMHAEFGGIFIDEFTAESLWEGDDLAAKVIELKPKMMLRQGFHVQISDMSPASLLEEALKATEDPQGAGVEEAYDAAAKKPAPKTFPPPKPITIPGQKQGRPQNLPPPLQASDDSNEIKEAQEAVQNKLDDLEAVSHVRKAEEYRRAYGGGALLMGIRDGSDMAMPVNERRILALEYLVPLRPREVWPIAWNSNPKSGSYGQPVRYRVQRETAQGGSSPFEVHASRVIRFNGIEVSKRQTARNRGWGASVLGRFYEVLRDFQTAYGGTATLLQDLAQAVYGMKGLAELMAAGAEGEELVIARARTLDLARSICKALLIDSEETFERKATPLAGVADLLDRWTTRLSAAADTPESLLFGKSPAGLNATGDANIRWYYDDIKSEQEIGLRRRLNRIVKVIFLSKLGPTEGMEPKRWKITFPSLWQETESEKATTRKMQADADVAYVNGGVVTPEEIAVSRFGGDEWSGDTKLDTETRLAMLKTHGSQIEPEPPPQIVMPGAKGAPPAKKPAPVE